jgi:hypothetical protein
MGMHFGILAAACPWPTLLAALREHAGDIHEATSSNGENWEIQTGEHQGRSYVADSSYLLSGGAPDLIVTLSKSTAGVVVGGYAETVSGSFGLVVADSGQLRRLYHACHSTLYEPLSIGEPLPTELTADLEDIDGGGLLAALRHFGFDYDAFYESDTRQKYSFSERAELESGELQRAIADHTAKHTIPNDQRPQPRVVARTIAGNSSSGGFSRWFKRLFGGQ